ncbi:MAG: hypothetical protein JWM24_199 [Solirubrobacterales bacterium]|nr:hypothetical protein [Solirubrobacterales bacterium]
MRSEAPITTSSFTAGESGALACRESGARHRRPGSRRSTSAWTVYAGADPAADLPWARGPQAVATVPLSLAGGAKRPLGFPTGGTPAVSEPIAALPGRRGSKSSVGDPKRFRSLSRPRGLGCSRLLASPSLTLATSVARIAASLLTVNEQPISAQTFRVIPTHHRLSPPASTGTSRGVPAAQSHPTRPARGAGPQEEN